MISAPSLVTPAKSAAQAETRQLILDTAERLFAERGIDAVSVRDITQAAGVNLGAVNYHFQTRDGLMVEVFTRRLRPLNEARLVWLSRVEQETLPGVPSLEQILEAFIAPTLGQHLEVHETVDSFCRLMCRCFQEPNPYIEAVLLDQFGEVVRRFHGAILQAVPSLPEGEVFWQLSFMIGSLHQALDTLLRFDSNPFTRVPGVPAPTALDLRQLAQRHILYTAAGIRASAGIRTS